ncbi:MAG: UvrD-helicase domain-containing protein, partial [Nanoarchaeota archaeon]|nr:UvrD-helicase domain-containing protein [Nanoarchaeota archaeon]
MANERDYVLVLKALQEIPFSVGKNLLIDFLRGDEDNKSIKKNKLYNLKYFGSLAYDSSELSELVEGLLLNDLIRINSVQGNKFWKVLGLTPKGEKEIDEPTLYKKKVAFNLKETKTEISDEDRKRFSVFGDFLSKYNDEQKKAIIDDNKSILCIAGAGSGKTTVLTKRIEFLIKYRGVDPSKILAITFTRKARQEMISRLPDSNVMIETFNSFCEKILRLHNDKIYGREVKVISYRDKITIINRALSMLKLNMARAIDIYFTYAQKRSKTPEQLARVFLNDCFFVRDYFKFKNKRIEQSAFQGNEHKDSANLMFGVCNYIEAFMKKNGLRDFADQLIDAIAFLEANPSFIPKFSHVLIDEYQDVNSTQIKLVDLLKVENIFCVGDPRQSIYGWRGSDIKYILNFEDKYKGCSVITLTKNYRSTKHIVSLINKSISKMGLADLESALAGEKEIQLIKFISEGAEFEFVAQGILASKLPREEIFVLARTNRQLNDLSTLLLSRGIKHIKRSDEMKASV